MGGYRWTEIKSGTTFTDYTINETIATLKEKYSELLATICVYEGSNLNGYRLSILIPTVALTGFENLYYSSKYNDDSTADCLGVISVIGYTNSVVVRASCHQGSTNLSRSFNLYAR